MKQKQEKIKQTALNKNRKEMVLENTKKIKLKITDVLFSIIQKNILFQNLLLLFFGLNITKNRKLQGSIEYIMILSAVTIIVVIALSMMTQLKGVILHSFYNSSGQSSANMLGNELKNLSSI